MNNPKGTLSAQQRIATAFTLFTAAGALLWAFPKFGEGGFLWTLSLPAAFFFVFFSYYVIAPVTSSENDIRGPSTLIVAVMWLIGRLIMNACLPETDRSWMASAMSWLTNTWVFALIIAALIAAFLRRVGRRGTQAPATNATSEDSIKSSPGDHSTAVVGIPAAADPVDSSSPSDTAPHQRVPAPVAAPPRPAPQLVATLGGASFSEVMTFLEIASSLGETESPASLLLELSPAGMTLSSAGLEIGTVSGTWSGAQALRARLSAQEARRELLSFCPVPATLTVQIRLEDEAIVELRADRSVQRVSLAAARA